VGAAAAGCSAGANAEEQNRFGSTVNSPVGETPSNVVLPVAVSEVDPVIATATSGSAVGVSALPT